MQLTLLEWITHIGGIAGAIVTIIGLIVMATKPFKSQLERLGKLESTMTEVKRDMETMKKDIDHAFEKQRDIEANSRTTDRALLALLNNALKGDNQEEMEKVKKDLEQHIWKEA